MDDDSVIVPALDNSVFLHKPDYPPRGRKVRKPAAALKFRRTFIPVLLTSGFILLALAGLHFLWLADNDPMAGLPLWIVVLMIVVGIGLWCLAALNMMAVSRECAAGRA